MKGKSKVVLVKDVPIIKAKATEIVTVKDGFFMNYLLPRGLAEKVNASTLEKMQASILAKAAVAAAALAEVIRFLNSLFISEHSVHVIFGC